MKSHPRLTPEAVEMLNAVKKVFTETPQSLNMEVFVSHLSGEEAQAAGCGTVGCIAGWLVTLFKDRVSPEMHSTDSKATALLGLDFEEDSHKLFFLWGWPIRFSNLYFHAGPDQRAAVTCKRIDYFIEHLK